MKHLGRNARGAARGLGAAVAQGVVLGVVLAAGAAPWSAALAVTSGKDRLAADLETLTKQQLASNTVIPDRDKPRTAQCLAKAIAADVPDADAGKLSDMFNRRAPFDKALEVKWLTIGKKDAPARYQQVINAVQKMCPDLEPYVEPMF
ncbi:MAG TPA: hypothetical protein VHE77_05530 [Dongiaceae bacterium]|nr:hypothetical protein [Dongiaceae bacterium]